MIKKLICSLVLVFGIVGSVMAWDTNSYSVYELSATSAQVFLGGGYLKGIALSTPTANYTYGDYYAIAYDTIAIANASYAGIASTSKIMFPRIFVATATAGLDLQPGDVHWFPEPGIFVSNGLWVFKNTANSGGALKAILYYKK